MLMRKILHWLPIALGLIFLLALGYLQRDRALRGQNDFVQLYTGAKLVGTPGLYSRATNLATVKSTLGFTMETVVYTRPPFYATLLRPLALLPYRTAYTVFSLLTLASLLWFVIRFSKDCPPLPFFSSMSLPALSALCGGQDTSLLVAILGASMLLVRRKSDFAAGLVLSLLAIKFHLFLFVPILLLLKRRWSILGGAATGTIALTVFGWIVAGADSLRDYIGVLRDPWINPGATGMPNVHGLIAALGGDAALEWVLVAAVAAAFLWIVRGTGNFEFLLAASLVCGLLVSFHAGIADTLVLIPAFVLVIGNCSSAPLRAAAGLILTPIPYFLILADAPYSALFPISLLVMLALFVISGRKVVEPAFMSGQTPALP